MNNDTIAQLRITHHARKAMDARAVSIEDVVEILRRPDVVEPNEGRQRYVGRGVALVIAWEGDRPVLVTVLLRRRAQWTNEDARARR